MGLCHNVKEKGLGRFIAGHIIDAVIFEILRYTKLSADYYSIRRNDEIDTRLNGTDGSNFYLIKVCLSLKNNALNRIFDSTLILIFFRSTESVCWFIFIISASDNEIVRFAVAFYIFSKQGRTFCFFNIYIVFSNASLENYPTRHLPL